MRSSLFPILLSAAALSVTVGLTSEGAVVPPDPGAITPNTLTCSDWVHNADGSWTAGAKTHPFDLGTATNQVVVNWIVVPNKEFYGGYDLWVALNQKCG